MRLLQRLLLYGFWHCVFYERIHCSKIPPSFIQSTLVLFKVNGTENTDNTDESTEPVSATADTTSLCVGVFVTRQHVLTTSKCALATKKLQMKPQRLLPKPFTRRRRTSMSRDAITGKKRSLLFAPRRPSKTYMPQKYKGIAQILLIIQLYISDDLVRSCTALFT